MGYDLFSLILFNFVSSYEGESIEKMNPTLRYMDSVEMYLVLESKVEWQSRLHKFYAAISSFKLSSTIECWTYFEWISAVLSNCSGPEWVIPRRYAIKWLWKAMQTQDPMEFENAGILQTQAIS